MVATGVVKVAEMEVEPTVATVVGEGRVVAMAEEVREEA